MPRTRRRKLRLGSGAKCWSLFSQLHPKPSLLAHCSNPEPRKKVTSLVATKIEAVTRQGRTYQAVFFSSEEFPGEELFCALHYCHVFEEGPPENFFDANEEDAEPGDVAPPAVPVEEVAVELDPAVFAAGNHAEDIEFVRNQGLEVDDDNEPAPENVPRLGENSNHDNLNEGQSWGFDFIDQRAITGVVDQSPMFQGGWNPKKKSMVDIFVKLLPWDFFLSTIIAHTSNALVLEKMSPLTDGEFLRYIGLWFLMATVSGFSRTDYWSTENFDEKTNPRPFHFAPLMSKRRFDAITRELRFTSKNSPNFVDRIWEVREMIVEWNRNMVSVFIPSWILCLDESMSIWNSMFTCPGWVFCPRKPHPFGNEYHTVCCAKSGILMQIELVEGKDRPKEMAAPLFAEKGKTVGLLLRLLEPYFTSGRYVVLDSGFCVLKGIVELKKKGIFAAALIKKRRYWPAFVPGKAMDSHFNNKQVGECDAISGVLDEEKYFIWGMKEPDYVMKIMASGGGLISDDNCKTVRRKWNDRNGVAQQATFQYTRPFDWHFRYRHIVDDHNNLRHSSPALEETWITKRWPVRVFAFLLAITEVNLFLVMKFFVWTKGNVKNQTYLDFRRKLAWELIDNAILKQKEAAVEERRMMLRNNHKHLNAPTHARCFKNGKWDRTNKQPYQQYKCRTVSCREKIRTYCSCNIGEWMCKDCYGQHMVEVTKQFAEDDN